MPIFVKLGSETSRQLTLLAADSHARTSATRATRPELNGARGVDYGEKCGELFANFDPDSLLWRTSQLCLNGEWAPYSGTWPKAGLMRSGKSYELPPLVPSTIGPDSSLLPTPQAVDGPSYYRISRKTSLKINRNRGQLHWMHVAILFSKFRRAAANPLFAETMMGFPFRWSSLKPNGNAIYPAIAEYIGKGLIKAAATEGGGK